MGCTTQGHWVGEVVDLKKHIGFVYMISDKTTGHAYIGRKQIWAARSGRKGCKSRIPDRSSDRWKSECWVESNWKEYKGSSKSWLKHMEENPTNDYEFRVLKTCASKGRLSYEEAKEQWSRLVLETKLEDGSRKYFNGQIGAIKFIPKEE